MVVLKSLGPSSSSMLVRRGSTHCQAHFRVTIGTLPDGALDQSWFGPRGFAQMGRTTLLVVGAPGPCDAGGELSSRLLRAMVMPAC